MECVSSFFIADGAKVITPSEDVCCLPFDCQIRPWRCIREATQKPENPTTQHERVTEAAGSLVANFNRVQMLGACPLPKGTMTSYSKLLPLKVLVEQR